MATTGRHSNPTPKGKGVEGVREYMSTGVQSTGVREYGSTGGPDALTGCMTAKSGLDLLTKSNLIPACLSYAVIISQHSLARVIKVGDIRIQASTDGVKFLV